MKGKVLWSTVIAVLAGLIIVMAVYNGFTRDNKLANNYSEALLELKEGKYLEASKEFKSLGNYRNASLYEKYCNFMLDFPEYEEVSLEEFVSGSLLDTEA